jgi:2-haloacid dehalogenase
MPDGAFGANLPTAVVFDLGGVLIDWDPRHLYRSLFADEAEMERFLNEVVTGDWNLEQDRGRTFAEGIAVLTHEHPDQAELIEAYWSRWPEMLGEPHHGTVAILEELRATGIRLLAMTNWSAETFPYAAPRYAFLAWFEAIVVSGQVRLTKPDPAIFQILVDDHAVDPGRTVFIDDMPANVDAATELGFQAIRFTDAAALRAELVGLGLLPAAGPDVVAPGGEGRGERPPDRP